MSPYHVIPNYPFNIYSTNAYQTPAIHTPYLFKQRLLITRSLFHYHNCVYTDFSSRYQLHWESNTSGMHQREYERALRMWDCKCMQMHCTELFKAVNMHFKNQFPLDTFAESLCGLHGEVLGLGSVQQPN